MSLGCRRVGSGVVGPYTCALGVIELVGVLSTDTLGIVRSIPVRSEGSQVRSGTLGPFPCTLGVVRCIQSIPVLTGGGQVRWCRFPCTLRVVGFVSVRSVHSRAPWWSSGLFVCSIFCTSCGSSGSLVCVLSIPVRHGGRRVCSCAQFSVRPVGRRVRPGVRSGTPVRPG